MSRKTTEGIPIIKEKVGAMFSYITIGSIYMFFVDPASTDIHPRMGDLWINDGYSKYFNGTEWKPFQGK